MGLELSEMENVVGMLGAKKMEEVVEKGVCGVVGAGVLWTLRRILGVLRARSLELDMVMVLWNVG